MSDDLLPRQRMALVDGFTCAAMRLSGPADTMREEATLLDVTEGLAAVYAGNPRTKWAWQVGIMAVRVLMQEHVSILPILEVVLSARTAKEQGHPSVHDSLMSGVCLLIRKQMIAVTGKDLPDPPPPNTLSPHAHR
jgi:hypothetical protein